MTRLLLGALLIAILTAALSLAGFGYGVWTAGFMMAQRYPIMDANLRDFHGGGQILPDGTATVFEGRDCIAGGGSLWCYP